MKLRQDHHAHDGDRGDGDGGAGDGDGGRGPQFLYIQTPDHPPHGCRCYSSIVVK